jgi:molybdopterin molybdotransferase
MKDMISVSEARRIVLEHAEDGFPEPVELDATVGRVLAQSIVARVDVPPFDNSAMDGYAVVATDLSNLPVDIRIGEDIPAGTTPSNVVTSGTCARIMTGAVLPDGADAVVPVEWTSGFHAVGENVSVSRAPEVGQHVRRAGDDIRSGATVLSVGTRILPSMIGTIASLGYDRVSVSARPRVSVVTTGSELIPVGEQIEPGKIWNSNGPALTALVRAAGAQVSSQVLARDDYAETIAALESASNADIMVVSGGVSVGSHDFVKDVLLELGMKSLFWRVRQRPGKPLLFGLLGSTLVFGLPGNPVSSTICFYQYIYPAIAHFLGATTNRTLRPAYLNSNVNKPAGLHCFVPGRSFSDVEGRLLVEASGRQGSHVYSSVASADCIIHLEEEIGSSPPIGHRVEIEPLPC